MHIVLLKCSHVQIAFLKFNSSNNQVLVGCIPILNSCTKSQETYWMLHVDRFVCWFFWLVGFFGCLDFMVCELCYCFILNTFLLDRYVLLSSADSCRNTNIYTHLPYHNDSIIETDARRKRQEDFFNNIFTSQFIARVRKGCSRFACERVLETEHKLHILTPLLWPSRCVFLFLLDAQPEVLGSTAGCWLSLLHLISIFSGPQFIRASSPIGLVWLSLQHLVFNSLEFY